MAKNTKATDRTVIQSSKRGNDAGWTYVRITMTSPSQVRLKVEMRCDMYKDQSYSKVSFWNGKEWAFVLDGGLLECFSHRPKPVDISAVEKEAEELEDAALKVVVQ